MIDIEAELELCRKATDGPWFIDDGSDNETTAVSSKERCAVVLAQHGDEDRPEFDPQSLVDCEFIIAARTNYPLALAELAELRKRVEAVREACEGDWHGENGAVLQRNILEIIGETP